MSRRMTDLLCMEQVLGAVCAGPLWEVDTDEPGQAELVCEDCGSKIAPGEESVTIPGAILCGPRPATAGDLEVVRRFQLYLQAGPRPESQ